MHFELTQEQQSIVEAVTSLCGNFPESYWRERDIDGVFPHDFYRAMGEAKRDAVRPRFCDACFTGDYPIALTDHDQGVPAQLSLLAENG